MNFSYVNRFNFEVSLNYLIVLYAFFLPISKAGIVFCTISIFLLWILQCDFTRKFSEVKENYFIVAIFAFILYSFIAVLWSDDKAYAISYVKKYYHFLLIPIIFTTLKKEYIEKVFSAFLLGMLISEITSYGIFFELWTKEGISPDDPSPFMSHSDYSTYLAFTIYILLHKIIYTDDLKWKLSYGLFFIFSMSNLFVNGGRTGQFAFILTFIIFAILNFKNKIKASIISLFFIASVFFISYNISPIFKARFDYALNDLHSMIYKKDYSNSFSARYAAWLSGITISQKEPILGTGIGDEIKNSYDILERFQLPSYFLKENSNYVDFHNMFVQYLVQLGIFGLIIILFIFYYLFKLTIKDKIYKNLLMLFLIIYVFHSMLGQSFHTIQSMVLFTLFSSIFLLINKFEQKENKDNAL